MPPGLPVGAGRVSASVETETLDAAIERSGEFVVVSVYVRPDGRRVVHVWGPPGTQREARNRAARMRTQDRKEYYGDSRLDQLSLHVCEISDDKR